MKPGRSSLLNQRALRSPLLPRDFPEPLPSSSICASFQNLPPSHYDGTAGINACFADEGSFRMAHHSSNRNLLLAKLDQYWASGAVAFSQCGTINGKGFQ